METKEHVSEYSISINDFDDVEVREDDPGHNFALVVLNFGLPAFTPALWKQSRFHICADGGANRLYDEMPGFFPSQEVDAVRRRYVPDVVKGDLDSLRAEVRDYYVALGTVIVDASEDQSTTDLHKCLAFLLESTPDLLALPNVMVLIIGALGGRFDHEMANVSILHRFAPQMDLVLLSDHCLVHLLQAGRAHVIRPNLAWQGPHCGLIPVGQPSEGTTTTGLRWNLDQLPMSFLTIISTSNQLAAETVTVQSDVDLVWTIEINGPPPRIRPP
eukprot:TRINITY_DN29437_c0_g1_i1.p1 TRINITY_DN29437_c0_g1~~TRINITY_DN29437_c0_g1_i1.p1  ORF type:complete len:273 (+),score=38.49 TRINITY_DN29437_c0_g1_i1:180-998(+)